jgi:Flp pilus assembly protein TadB
VAQTKRKRRTKHRGNAAGTIETRGRTGRAPTAEERKKQTRVDARERRLNTPPTWRSSFNRALVAAAIMFAFLVITTKKNRFEVAIAFAVIALALYVPLGYSLETFLYRRRQRAKATTQGKPR